MARFELRRSQWCASCQNPNIMIKELKPNQIFVFGSNLAGKHCGGAARQAKEAFGAVEDVGEGITGQCYAFPTLDERLNKRIKPELFISVVRLYAVCADYPDKEFLLTPVGTGIAGFKVSFMKTLFTKVPKNLVLPDEFK